MNYALQTEERVIKVISLLKYLSKALGISAVVVGILVLFGWQYNIEFLKRVNTSSVAMNPTSAVCFVLCGISLLLFQKDLQENKTRKIIAYSCAIMVIAIALTKLISIITNLHLPVDEVLFKAKLDSAEDFIHLPNRMAPNTAFNFMLSGLALMLLDADVRRSSRTSQFIITIVVLVSLLSLYGYIYGVKFLYGIMAFIPMAVHTAFGFLILSLGVLFARPNRGAMAAVIESGSKEIVLLEIIAFLLPLAFGWLQIKGQQEGYYSPEFGTAIFVILTYIISMFFMGRSSWLQHQLRKEKEMTHAIIEEHAQKLQSILDNSATPIVIKDVKGRYLLVNKQFERLFHVNGEEIIGKTVYDVFKKGIADSISRLDEEVLQSGQLKHIEEEYPVEDNLHTFITVKFPLRDKQDNIYAVCGVSTDITYRKELENTLRENEQQQRAILQNLGEGVVVADTNGNFLSFNKVAEDIMGMGATEGPIHGWTDKYGLFLPDGVTKFPTEDIPLAKALKGESTDEVEMFIRNQKFPDGKQISITGRPVQNDKGEVIAGVVVFRDITQRKRLEKLIYDNEKRLRLVISSIGEGIAVADTNGKFLLFNKKAEEILGIGAMHGQLDRLSSIYGLYKADGITPFPTEDIPLVKALRGEATDNIEIYVKNDKLPEGKIILATGRPILDEQGNITAGIVDFRDITELKRLESTLEQIQERYKTVIDFRHRNPESN